MTIKEREAALNHRMKAAKNDEAAAGASFGCECADLRCNAKLELTQDERVRRGSRPSRFWVKPGHELDSDHIVETDTRFSVVQLDGIPLYAVPGGS